MRKPFLPLLGWAALLLSTGAEAAEPVRIAGSERATAPFVTAIPMLREQGIELSINAESNSSAAIAQVGQGTVDCGATTRPITPAERATFPQRDFLEHSIGVQIVVPLVPIALQGSRPLSQEQLRHIYEGRITNWRELGGPDLPLKFLNPAQGDGVWEVLTTWLYGSPRRAPLGDNFPLVEGPLATRRALLAEPGTLTLGFSTWADGTQLAALSLQSPEGRALPPTLAGLQAGYPLHRPLFLVTAGRPAGTLLRFFQWLRSEPGAAALHTHDFLLSAD